MQICTLCHHPTAAEDPFCSSCGHARIAESLQTPVERPPWFNKACMAGAAIVGVWLVITLGVAFLREAKALRWARSALESNEAVRAYGLVSPFVKSNPDHAEGLYLAGDSAIKSGRLPEAKAHYFKLASLVEDEGAVERTSRLEAIYHEQILANAAGLSCDRYVFPRFYGAYEVLGEKFHDTLVRSAASVAGKCVVSGERYRLNEPGYWLIKEKKLEAEYVVTHLYVEPLKPALERGQYYLASMLAQQGVRQWPDAKSRVDDTLSETRSKVAKTVQVIQDLCSSLSKDTEFLQGRSRCFPASSPAAVLSQQDAWGNSLTYSPLALNEETQCHRDFVLASLGADARQTPDDTATPAMEISCRYDRGRQRLQRPDRFWLPRK